MDDNHFDGETKDFNDFVIGDTTPDNSPENVAFLQQEFDADWDAFGITLH